MLGGLEKKNALVMEVLEHGGLIVAGGEEQLSLDRLLARVRILTLLRCGKPVRFPLPTT